VGVPAEGPLALAPEQLYLKSYGRSLLAGVCDTYHPDFALHATTQPDPIPRVVADVQAATVVRPRTHHHATGRSHTDRPSGVGVGAAQLNILDEPVASASCLVINTDDGYVCRRRGARGPRSLLVRLTQRLRSGTANSMWVRWRRHTASCPCRGACSVWVGAQVHGR
jgi:hypothetical protein